MNSLFVTGTDTDVGKTVVTAALVATARAAGRDVVPMKPVQTGCIEHDGQLSAPDLDLVLRMAGLSAEERSAEEQALMCPYRFIPPCSPHLAALQAQQPISLNRIGDALKSLQAVHDAVIVEGAGGCRVPLGPTADMRDLACELDLDVVVAARPGLGTLNHTLMTVESLLRVGLTVAAVVIVQSTEDPIGIIEQDNLFTIGDRTGIAVLGPIPFISDLADPDFTPAQFKDIVTPFLNTLVT
ncbi:MAG: dethiobiotin synthase [Kiritimatiellae bacterium]|nr:dethiobiotin synthase [Kiritimatiellia bacterium]